MKAGDSTSWCFRLIDPKEQPKEVVIFGYVYDASKRIYARREADGTTSVMEEGKYGEMIPATPIRKA